MGILIDGYNLAYASGILSGRGGPGGLEKARGALLNVLAASLPAEEAQKTVIVFDANDAYVEATPEQQHGGIRVLYAVKEEDADSLIEQLIAQDSAPRQLLVVSSDRRLQRAARRRRAKSMGSEEWYDQLLARRRQTPRTETPAKPKEELSDAEVDYWLREFGEEA